MVHADARRRRAPAGARQLSSIRRDAHAGRGRAAAACGAVAVRPGVHDNRGRVASHHPRREGPIGILLRGRASRVFFFALIVAFPHSKRSVRVAQVANTSSTCGAASLRATNVGDDKWYRFVGSGGDALPVHSPQCLHCGTDRVGWLSGWEPSKGTPPPDYTAPGSYPPPGAGEVNATVCFDYCDPGYAGSCRSHVTVGVVNCGGYYLWRLPFAPDCASGYCTAPSSPPPPRPPPGRWSGPTLQLSHTDPGGFPALQLSSLPGGSVFPPFWLNLNNQGYPNVSAIAVQITRARIARLPLLALVLDDALAGPMQREFSTATHSIFNLIEAHHPTAKVLVRWYLTGPWDSSPNATGNMVLQNISNPNQTQAIGVSSPTAQWAHAAAANLSVALANLDSAFPGTLCTILGQHYQCKVHAEALGCRGCDCRCGCRKNSRSGD